MVETLITLFDKVIRENTPLIRFESKVEGSWKTPDVKQQIDIAENVTADDIFELEKIYRQLYGDKDD